MNNLLVKEKVNSVAEEIKSLMVEAVWESHYVLIVATHTIGKLIVDNFGENMAEVLPSLALKVGRSERTLYRAAQLYRKWPKFDSMPLEKNSTMNKLITQHLLEPGEKKEEGCRHCPLKHICP